MYLTHKLLFRALPDVPEQGAVCGQGLFPCQAPKRRYGTSGRAPFGRAVDRPSVALRSPAMEQPLPRERALYLTGQQLAEGQFVYKENGWI